MNKKYLMLDLDDERISNLADVLGNKTSKKIIEYLSDKEASETEIARDLNLAANTVNYNIDKLLKSGLIEKSKNFFWSVKGKKIITYTVSNKKVVISPKVSKGFFNIMVTAGIVGLSAFLVKVFFVKSYLPEKTTDYEINALPAAEGMADAGVKAGVDAIGDCLGQGVFQIVYDPNIWLWFLAGGVFALAVYITLEKIKRTR